MSHVKVHSSREYMCCGPPNQEFRIAIHSSSSHHGRRCKSTDWNGTCTQLTWPYNIASIQCVYPNRWRSTQGRCKCSVCRCRMELYLHHLLLVHCLVDHPRNRSSIQWPRTQKISASITLPGVHGCGCVCWGLLQTPRVHRTNKDPARTTFQWMFWGYSLAYARDASPFIGTLKNFGLRGVMVAPSPGSADLPEIVFCFYQLLFCACTVINTSPLNVANSKLMESCDRSWSLSAEHSNEATWSPRWSSASAGRP